MDWIFDTERNYGNSRGNVATLSPDSGSRGRGRCLLFALAGLLLLPAWAGAAPAGSNAPVPERLYQVRFEFVPYPPPYVTEATLAGIIGITPPAMPSPRRLQDAVKNLYALHVFRQIEVFLAAEEGGNSLTFRFHPFGQLGQVRWQGVRLLKKKEVEKGLDLGRRTLLTDEYLNDLKKKVQEAYQRNGYLEAAVQVTATDNPPDQDLRIEVREGPRYRNRRPDIELIDVGVLLPEVEVITGAMGNTLYRNETFERAGAEIERIYHERGYPAVRVEYFLAPGDIPRTVIPVFILETGPRVQILVEGVKVNPRDVQPSLAIYRLADVSTFAEEISREDLAGYLKKSGYRVRRIMSSRKEDPGNNALEIVFQADIESRIKGMEWKITGNQAFTRRELLAAAGIESMTAAAIPLTVPFPVSAVEKFYHEAGYLAVTAQATATLTRDRLRVELRIEEGPLFTLGAVTLPGFTGFSPAELEPELARMKGSTLTPTLVQDIRSLIDDSVSRQGFIIENLQIDQTKTGPVVDLTVRLRLEGPYWLDNVAVIGALSTKPAVMRRLIPLQGGQSLDLSATQVTESKLFGSGIFDRVVIGLPVVHGRPEARNAIISLREAPRYSFGYGFGYQEWEGLRGLLEWNDNNFFGRGLNSGFLFRGSRKKVLFQWTVFGESLLFGKYPLSMSAYIGRDEQVPFTSQRISLSWQTSRSVGKSASLIYHLSFEKIRNYDIDTTIDPSTIDRREAPITLTTLSGSYFLDTRDNFIDPLRGRMRTVSVSFCPKVFGADTGYLKFFFQEQYYRSIRDMFVLAASFRFGLIRTIWGSDQVPISERYFAGGAETLRGYGVDMAGPLDPVTHSPLGGKALLIGNAELRFPIYSLVHGALFYDVGNVFTDISAFNLDDLTHSVGAGLRLQTPVGPIRLDFGYSLRDVPYDKDNQFFITIGNTF